MTDYLQLAGTPIDEAKQVIHVGTIKRDLRQPNGWVSMVRFTRIA